MDASSDALDNSNEGSTTIAYDQIHLKVLDASMMHRCDECNKLDEEVNAKVFDEYYKF